MPTLLPQAGAPREYAFPDITRTTLPNGVRVAVASMPRLPLVTVLAVVDAGASRDEGSAEGIARLTAETLREGTTRFDGGALTEQSELLGTELGAGADWDSAFVKLTVMPQRLQAGMSLLGEVIREPAFSDRDVERLRAERLAALLQLQVEPRGLADDKFSEFLYASSSRYAVPEGGSIASVRRVDAVQMRKFHGTHYAPGVTTLILVGDLTAERGSALVERSVGAWTGAAPVRAPVDVRMASATRRVRVVHKPDAPQTELRVGHRGVPRTHPDYFSIVVMNALLGGLFSSRINLNLRERNGFTYGAHSAFDWRCDAGPFVVSTAVKTEVTGPATREILREIARLRDETVTSEELSLATAYLDGVYPIRYETTQAVAEAIASAEVFGLGDDYFDRYRHRVRAVTAADVRRAAESHLHPDELLVLAVGDAEAICKPLEELDIGPMEVHEAGGGGVAT